MTERHNEDVLRSLTGVFAERVKRSPLGEGSGMGDALASVRPSSVEEVSYLAQVAARYSLPLVPLGAETGFVSPPPEGSILVRFDLMRHLRLPVDDEPWVEAGPGASWLELEDELRVRGRGLAVYPTSAPRATVGGWLATDGLGVGSFEFGRLWENVLRADVVPHGGGLREVGGEELGHFFGPGKAYRVVVGARLRTRRADADRPFAAAFSEPGGVAEAVAALLASEAPLWHLAFVNPTMAAARGLRERYLLFGAYPSARDTESWWGLRRRVLGEHGGVELDGREAWRVWGERFFPVAPAHPTPHAARRFVALGGLARELEGSRPKDALQGTVGRSGEVLLLRLGDEEEGSA
jgi:FAD/FMN-containing dehydrogenase